MAVCEYQLSSRGIEMDSRRIVAWTGQSILKMQRNARQRQGRCRLSTRINCTPDQVIIQFCPGEQPAHDGNKKNDFASRTKQVKIAEERPPSENGANKSEWHVHFKLSCHSAQPEVVAAKVVLLGCKPICQLAEGANNVTTNFLTILDLKFACRFFLICCAFKNRVMSVASCPLPTNRASRPNCAEAIDFAARKGCCLPIIGFPLRRSRRVLRRNGKKQCTADRTTPESINRLGNIKCGGIETTQPFGLLTTNLRVHRGFPDIGAARKLPLLQCHQEPGGRLGAPLHPRRYSSDSFPA